MECELIFWQLNQQVSLEPVVTQSWQNQYILPFSRDQNFVGREEIIDNIDLILSDDRTVRRLALVGLGGIGYPSLFDENLMPI